MFKSKNGLSTLIGESASFEGNIKSKNIVRIDGIFKGIISCTSGVFLSEKGEIIGNINSQFGNITIKGKITGDIISKNLFIGKNAILKGKISTEKITVEEGANLNSQIEMIILKKDKNSK